MLEPNLLLFVRPLNHTNIRYCKSILARCQVESPRKKVKLNPAGNTLARDADNHLVTYSIPSNVCLELQSAWRRQHRLIREAITDGLTPVQREFCADFRRSKRPRLIVRQPGGFARTIPFRFHAESSDPPAEIISVEFF